MDPHLIFNLIQLLAILAILAGVAWLLLRGAPDRGRTFRWAIMAAAGIVTLVLAISLLAAPFEQSRSDESNQLEQVAP